MVKTSVAGSAGAIAKELAQQMGYIFVAAELKKENGASFLRIFIDHEDGLSLEKCEAYHRRLNKLVGELEYDYLEVSSPGLDRPLKTDTDLNRAMHKAVTAKLYTPLNGQKAFEGELNAYTQESITLLQEDQQPLVLPRNSIAKLSFLIEDVPDQDDLIPQEEQANKTGEDTTAGTPIDQGGEEPL